MYAKCLKRVTDFSLSALALLILSPLLLVLTVVGAWQMKGNPFFTQLRPGKDEKIFKLYKFRTMTDEKDANGNLLPDDIRLTKFGRLLRSTSLDELPELVNILLGQMSIVGPRPALWNQFDLVEEREKYGAHQVRPGLTGWAQINGRDELPIDVKARLDGQYVERLSFLFDCKCFFGTILAVLRRDGVVEGGTGAMMDEKDKVSK